MRLDSSEHSTCVQETDLVVLLLRPLFVCFLLVLGQDQSRVLVREVVWPLQVLLSGMFTCEVLTSLLALTGVNVHYSTSVPALPGQTKERVAKCKVCL